MARPYLVYSFLGLCASCLVLSYVSYRLLAFLPILCVLIGACAWPWVRQQSTWHMPRIVAAILGAIVLAALPGFVLSDYTAELGERLTKLLPLFASAVLLTGFAGAQGGLQDILADKVRQALFWVFSILVAVFFVDYALGLPLYALFHPDYEPTVKELLPQLNRYMIIPLICFVLIILSDLPRWQKVASALAMMAMFFVTESQSVQMTFILLLLFWAVWPFVKRWALWIFGAGVSVFTLGFPYLAIWMFESRPQNMGVLETKGAGFNRLEIWSGLSDLAIARPFFGYGLEATRYLSLPIEHLYWADDTILHPHNYALQLWIEFGLFGVILFLAAFWYGLSCLRKYTFDIQYNALSLMIVIIGINLSAYGLWQGWWLGLSILAVFFGVLLSRSKMAHLKI